MVESKRFVGIFVRASANDVNFAAMHRAISFYNSSNSSNSNSSKLLLLCDAWTGDGSPRLAFT